MIVKIKPLAAVLTDNTKPTSIRFQGMVQCEPDVVTLHVSQAPIALRVVAAKALR
jgi:hypothetical protein